MTENDWQDLAIRAGEVFTPAAPIDAASLFAGRIAQLRQVVDAVSQKGQHAIIFGERGVGKTSLANIISTKLTAPRVLAPRINCDTSDTYSSMWKKMFEQITLTQEIRGIGIGASTTEETMTLAKQLGRNIAPEDVRQTLARLSSQSVPILIIDEFDRIRDAKVRATIADTIKTLSDHAIAATIVLVGVADSVTELIEQHQSVERALMQIHMPRMSNEELREIIEKGMQVLDMVIESNAKEEIANLSLGLPHYTHALALQAVRAAADSKSHSVTLRHVEVAIETALQLADQSIRTAYHRATTSVRKDTIFSHVLLACALARTDDLGYFAAGDIREPLREITGKTYNIPNFAPHLYAFCGNVRGPILQQMGISYRNRYRFLNPLMQPYIVMQGKAKGLIGKEPTPSAPPML
jgi:Cdc6-like AAA superfamily ATPase